MSQSELSVGSVSLGDMREVARLELLELLDSFPGSKTLIWDSALTGPMGLVAEYSVLKQHQVVNMFSLAAPSLPPATSAQVVFLVRPVLSLMDTIAAYIKREERSGGSGVRTEYRVVFVPRESLLCRKRLVEAEVSGSLRCHSLPVYLFSLDSDLLSMELPNSFRETVEGDKTSLHHAATALTRLQAFTGVIPRVYGKGHAAAQVFDLMVRMRRESCGRDPEVRSQIDSLVIIDRAVDLISPLPTQLTYEGLVDEMFGITCATVTLPEPEKKTLSLTSQEELFQELRGLNFNAVGPTLSRKARGIKAMEDQRHEAKTPRELRAFVDKLPVLQATKQSLATHTGLAERVKEKIDSEEFLQVLELEQRILTGGGEGGRYLEEVEDLACCGTVSLESILRVVCLQSVVCGGLKPKVFEAYHRLLMEAFGYNQLLSLHNLSTAGLLVSSSTNKRSQYSVLSKRLGIIMDNVDEQSPHDIAYVHTVYAPLSVRLVQQLEAPGWRNIRDVLDMLPGPSFEDTQQIAMGGGGQQRRRGPGDRKVVLVFYVGGVTMAEVAALRWLSNREGAGVEYVIATTSVITGNSFIRTLYDKLEAPIF